MDREKQLKKGRCVHKTDLSISPFESISERGVIVPNPECCARFNNGIAK